MRVRRPAAERGQANHGWLRTWHTFSFADYDDAGWRSWRHLRVMNEDWFDPGHGFGMHPHRDMEIVTWVLEGTVEHADSTGGHGVLVPGDVQAITAGRGLLHSETNPSPDRALHLYQVWLLPERPGLDPAYAQRSVAAADLADRFGLLVSRDGREGSLTIHQDADILAARLGPGKEVRRPIAANRHVWVQAAAGAVTVNGEALAEGDGIGLRAEFELVVAAAQGAEVLVFDMG